MEASRLFACTALMVLLAGSIAEAASIGCFTAAQASLQPQPGSFTEETCRALCADKQLPLYALYCDVKCACSAAVPDASAQADGCGAAAASAACGAAIELQYIYSRGAEVCGLAPYPFTPKTLDLGMPADAPMVSIEDGMLTLSMDGRDGARVQTKEVMKYGLFEIKIQAAPGPGVVSTFYLIDQLQVPPVLQDEIDLEFLNQGKLFTEPNIFWTNIWASPNATSIREHQLYSASEIAPMLGDPSFTTTSGLHTYLVDWQPGYIRWYIEGVLVDHMDVSQGAIPSHPMYSVMSLWTQTNTTDCVWFGGCLPVDNKLTYKARFTDYKRVRCYDPEAPYFNTTLAAEILAADPTRPIKIRSPPPRRPSSPPAPKSPRALKSPPLALKSPPAALDSPKAAASPPPAGKSPADTEPILPDASPSTASTTRSAPVAAGSSTDRSFNGTLKGGNSSPTSAGAHRHTACALGQAAALAAAMAVALFLAA